MVNVDSYSHAIYNLAKTAPAPETETPNLYFVKTK